MLFKFKHVSAIIFSGSMWFFMGALLIFKGMSYISEGALAFEAAQNVHFSLISFTVPFFSSLQKSVFALVIASCSIGYFKGHFVMSKTVNRMCRRIITLHAPFKIQEMYTKGYVILICSMMILGMSMRFIPISADVRGVLDLAVGVALMKGSFLFFKRGLILREELRL
ncbi:MAG: hypothetical protein KAR79_02275 [Simkaniaceae bacterium]|nr:hypothetical protein [Simkaniaceae bacterium]